jgi:hypothetical protein
MICAICHGAEIEPRELSEDIRSHMPRSHSAMDPGSI